jgi:hypothetical protein
MNLYVSLFDGIWRVFLNDLRQTFDPVFTFSLSCSLPLRQTCPIFRCCHDSHEMPKRSSNKNKQRVAFI